eukprot:3467978-Alexandrium_andersonii.AAC.1
MRGPADVGIPPARAPAADRVSLVFANQEGRIPRAQAAARVGPRRATSAAETRAVIAHVPTK